jgi:uncharacterized protein (TIGR01777 family)
MNDQANKQATKRIGITGSSGLIGTALVAALRDAGFVPVPIVRRTARDGEIEWHPQDGRLDPAAIAGLDAVVNLAGAGIGDHRWTDEYRRTIVESRVAGTTLLASTYAELGDDAPGVLVNASAIGYYGPSGDAVLTESSPSGDGFLADVCRQWEDSTAAAEPVTRVALLRTGIVLSPDGGALAKMLPLFKLALGGRFGDGEQWMSWISLPDEIAAILHVLDGDIEGPVNLTAPEPVTNREFAKTLADALNRPAFLPVPKFGPKLLLGGDLAQALLFDSQRVLPTVLDDAGFDFAHPTLATAFDALLD